MTKPGAPKGNQNAKKAEPKIIVNFRVPESQHQEYKKKADDAGISLTQWIIEKLSL